MKSWKAMAVGALMSAVVILFSSILFIIVLFIWNIINNYQNCTLPFEQECWRPDNVYYDDPIRDEEILSMVKHMEDVRNRLGEKDASQYSSYYTTVPVYDAQKIKEQDLKTHYQNGRCKLEEGCGTISEETNGIGNISELSNGIHPLAKGTYTPYSDTYGDGRTFGGNRKHEGNDIMASKGTKLYSATDGKVVKKGWNEAGGWRISIKTGNFTLYYAHLQKYAPGIGVGDTVKKGDLIGYVGDSGYGPKGTTGKFDPHLHFGIYGSDGKAVNPHQTLKAWESGAKSVVKSVVKNGAEAGGLYKVTTQPEDTPELRENLKKVLGRNVVMNGRPNKFRNNIDHYVDVVIQAGKTEGIDPRFVVAIMVHETGYGTSYGVHTRNNTGGIICVNKPEFGTTGCSGGFSIFSSLDGSIRYKANILKRLYVNEGLLTVPQVGSKYAPIGAANDPNNLNANWVPNTGLLLKSMGITEDIGVPITGIIDFGDGYNTTPELTKYPQMQVRKVEIADGVYKNVTTKELNKDIKSNLVDFFSFQDDFNIDNVWAGLQTPQDAVMSEAELHLRTLIQMDMEGTIGLDRLDYETAHAFLRASRGLSSGGSDSKDEKDGGDVKDTNPTEAPSGEVMYMESTAYIPMCGAGCSGITAIGIDARVKPTPRVIAVDPKVIPLRTYVHVEGYGYAIAGDTGGAIKGNIIDVLVPDGTTARNWGRKHNVKVTILKEKPAGFDSPITISPGEGSSNDSIFTKIPLKKHKEAFVKWAKEIGYDKEVDYKDDNELIKKLLLSSEFTNKQLLLREAAKDELVYPLMVYYMGKMPKIADFTKEKAEEQLNKIIKEKKISKQTLSVLAIGHYMKRNAFEEFKATYTDDFGVFAFNKEDAEAAFKKYVQDEKAKADMDKALGDFKNKANSKKTSWWSKLGNDAMGLITSPGRWMQGTYFDMKVKGNTFIRFAIYEDTTELMEIGSYSRSLCFFTEPYAQEEKGKVKEAWGKFIDKISEVLPGSTAEDGEVTDDFCARINNIAYDTGRVGWEDSQVLDKTKETYNLSFYCEMLPAEEIQKQVEKFEEEERKRKEEEERRRQEAEQQQQQQQQPNKNQEGGSPGGLPAPYSDAYKKKMEDLFFSSYSKPFGSLKLSSTMEPVLTPVIAGEFKDEKLKVKSPYDTISGPTIGYLDVLDDVETESSQSQGEAENIYGDVNKAYNNQGGSGTVKIKNDRGVIVGKIDKNGDSYVVEWIDFQDNSQKTLTVSPTNDCMGKEYKHEKYDFQTHKPAYKYDKTVDAYYQTPWDAFVKSKNFNLYHTNLKMEAEKNDADFFRKETIESFFTMTNIDESKNKEWKEEMGKWLTGGMAVQGNNPGSGNPGGNKILDPSSYEGIEFQFPIAPAADGKLEISSGYGPRWGKMHHGLDLVNHPNPTLFATADGVVTYAQFNGGGYGNRVVIMHELKNGKKLYSTYNHMKNGSMAVKVGDKVTRGQVVGTEGTTGASQGNHLHFEFYYDGPTKANSVNPAPILNLTKANAKCQGPAGNCPL